MKGIIVPTNTVTDESEVNSSAQVNTLFFALEMPTPCLSGANSSTIADSTELTAQYSETKRQPDTGHRTLSDRLTPLLISAGLVKGITHSSVRKQSGAAIRASALWPLDGGDAE
jgi:hypothetical protein